jgi:hypothetical protein
MTIVTSEDPDHSALSHGEESDSMLSPPEAEPEPAPGLRGAPVRCTYFK